MVINFPWSCMDCLISWYEVLRKWFDLRFEIFMQCIPSYIRIWYIINNQGDNPCLSFSVREQINYKIWKKSKLCNDVKSYAFEPVPED